MLLSALYEFRQMLKSRKLVILSGHIISVTSHKTSHSVKDIYALKIILNVLINTKQLILSCNVYIFLYLFHNSNFSADIRCSLPTRNRKAGHGLLSLVNLYPGAELSFVECALKCHGFVGYLIPFFRFVIWSTILY
jgi:hypothetical protein